MQGEILHITNGDCLNEYLSKRLGGECLPFREAMMDGDAADAVYSDEFIRVRAKALDISEAAYRENMGVCERLKKCTYKIIYLWFGKDTFCQMNLLGFLTYLEQIAYCGRVILRYIDDESFAVIQDDIEIKLGIYSSIYRDIFSFKRMPREMGVLDRKAIDLYFDYHASDGMLAELIKQNGNMDKDALIALLLEASADYGLSDLQAERLVGIYGES